MARNKAPEVPALSNRKRLIAIMEILQRKSDNEQGITLSEIIAELKYYFGYEFHVTIPAVKEDILSLQDSGIDIDEEKAPGFATKYKWSSRRFDIYELRIMIDAVASAHSLTVEDSETLIEKIKLLTSENQARKLGNRLFVEDHIKTKTNVVKFYIGNIHEAILNRQKITFQYRKFDIQKKLELYRNGVVYTARPYALVWNQDHYYLIAYHDESSIIKTFRVDRLYKVSLINEYFEDPDFNVAQFVNHSFHMYSGEPATVKIKFRVSLLNAVLDRFGDQASLYPVDEHWFIISIQATLSEGLLRWILTWGADAEVLSPPELVKKMEIESEKMFSLYSKR